jgi:hypothetical protein
MASLGYSGKIQDDPVGSWMWLVVSMLPMCFVAFKLLIGCEDAVNRACKYQFICQTTRKLASCRACWGLPLPPFVIKLNTQVARNNILRAVLTSVAAPPQEVLLFTSSCKLKVAPAT